VAEVAVAQLVLLLPLAEAVEVAVQLWVILRQQLLA
jgi:hypothetical protein